jgi:hypothetical protein
MAIIGVYLMPQNKPTRLNTKRVQQRRLTFNRPPDLAGLPFVWSTNVGAEASRSNVGAR